MAENKIAYYWGGNKSARAEEAAAHVADVGKRYEAEISDSVKNTLVYTPESTFKPKEINEFARGYLRPVDSVSALYEDTVGKVAILNFASYKNPGGGYLAGSRAQEECLCSESTLYNVLSRCQDYYTWNNKHLNHGYYSNRALYSPGICFERNDIEKVADVITCAAPNFSVVKKYADDDIIALNSDILDSRIKFVLDIAADRKVDTLIIGAYGCGVFGQDPSEVISIFNKYLTSTHKCFTKVVYAIPATVHSDNYVAARKVFLDLIEKRKKEEA